MYFFPDFVSLSVFSFISLSFFKDDYFEFFVRQFLDLHVFVVGDWKFISVLWWYQVCLIFLWSVYPCIVVPAFEGASLGRCPGRQDWSQTVSRRDWDPSQGCFRVHSWDQDLQAHVWGHRSVCLLPGLWWWADCPQSEAEQRRRRVTGCFKTCSHTKASRPAFRGLEECDSCQVPAWAGQSERRWSQVTGPLPAVGPHRGHLSEDGRQIAVVEGPWAADPCPVCLLRSLRVHAI